MSPAAHASMCNHAHTAYCLLHRFTAACDFRPGRHTSRFLLCYILVGLPLLMWPLASWGAPMLFVAIAVLVLGIEEISAFIEKPFRVSNTVCTKWQLQSVAADSLSAHSLSAIVCHGMVLRATCNSQGGSSCVSWQICCVDWTLMTHDNRGPLEVLVPVAT
jgi:hypothetical protein